MRKSSLVIGALLSCTLSLQTFADSSVIATVNGKDITLQDYYEHVGAPPNANIKPEPAIINNMINRELVVQKALTQGLDKETPFVKILENLKYNALFDFGMQKFLHSQPISDERLRAEYKNFPPLTQYKVRHILVKTQAEAQNLIKEIQAGKKFDQLAAQYSIDPMTRPRGGDLNWLTKEQILPEVAKVVVEMKKGTFHPQPIQSKVGWHVVLLENTRELPPIPFEAARGRLTAKIHDQMAAEYFKSLRAEAKVEIK